MPEGPTYIKAIGSALADAMDASDELTLLGIDIARGGGVYGVTDGLYDRFGAARVRDTPIAEAGVVGAAVGAAMAGVPTVVEIMYMDFISVCLDPIVNQAAKLRYMFGGKARVPLVIRAQEGAGRGNAAQHSQSLEAWFCHIPGLKVVTPSTPADAKGLLKSAIRDDNPVIFLEHKVLYFAKGPVPEGDYTVPLGVADVKREGKHVTVVGVHTMVGKALKAAEQLAEEGIELEVIDPRTLVPLDEQTIIDSVKKTGRLIVTHEAYTRGGYGAEIISRVVNSAFDYLDAPPQRVCARDVPVPYNATLETAALPQVEDLVAVARALVNREI
jgi:pyruvate dehydrogenase E1 component beta subunit